MHLHVLLALSSSGGHVQVFERLGTYYMLYSTGTTHRIAYATATSAHGPFTYRGAILHPVWGWTTHGSAVEWRGLWYYFYHDSSCSGGETARRCVKATRMHFNGTAIAPISTEPNPGPISTAVLTVQGGPAIAQREAASVRDMGAEAASVGDVEAEDESVGDLSTADAPRVPDAKGARAAVVVNGATRVDEDGLPVNAHQGSMVYDPTSRRYVLYGNHHRDCAATIHCHCVGAEEGWTVTTGISIYSSPWLSGPWRHEAGPILAPFNQPRVIGPLPPLAEGMCTTCAQQLHAVHARARVQRVHVHAHVTGPFAPLAGRSGRPHAQPWQRGGRTPERRPRRVADVRAVPAALGDEHLPARPLRARLEGRPPRSRPAGHECLP